MTNRCNLRCRHCYISAEDRRYQDELTTDEAKAFITDLANMKAPVLLFSGGEPLIRKDIFELGRMAADLGLRPVISSNGTLIDQNIARQIKEAGFQYVGISIDGKPSTHDEFRNMPGAFAAALKGIHACMSEGIKTGIRFTVNRYNQADLPEIPGYCGEREYTSFLYVSPSICRPGSKKWLIWTPVWKKPGKSWIS